MLNTRLRDILAAPLAAALVLAPLHAPEAVAAPSGIAINEVVTQGTDWVELYNNTDTAIDISGWTAIDSGKESTPITFPAGTVVPARGFYSFQTEDSTPDASKGFGLGSKDSITLRDASGAKVDSFTWTKHAETSWARTADGTGDFAESLRATRGAANERLRVVVNEIDPEGEPADWVELANPTGQEVDISDWTAVDGDPAHAPVTFPEGTVIPAGGYYAFYTDGKSNTPDGTKGFGLGKSDDTVTIADADGKTVDTHTYTGPAALPTDRATSIGRIPDMRGEFAVTGEKTRGAANVAYVPEEPAATPKVVINEVESNGDPVADWFELYNTGTTDADISGWKVLDNDDSHTPLVFPAGTVLKPGAFARFYTEGAQAPGGGKGFGLGGNDKVRLFAADGTAVDEAGWSAHAADTWGRLPDGTGAFTDTKATPGAKNEALAKEETKPLDAAAWPVAGLEITDIDLGADFNTEDMSGVDFDQNGRAWVVNNGKAELWALDYDDAAGTYSVGGRFTLRYGDGTGIPDAEGVTVGPDGALYVATERDNADKKVSRPSVLRYEVASASEGSLNASGEWNLAEHVGPVAPNGGLEAIAYIPEQNVFAVGVEETGEVLFVSLGDNGASTLVQRLKTPFKGVMALDYDRQAKELRALCDEVCDGQSILITHNGTEFAQVSEVQARPEGMTENFANEGYARYFKEGTCEQGTRTDTTRYLWADDGATNGVALRGAVAVAVVECEAAPAPAPAPAPGDGSSGSSGSSLTPGWIAAAVMVPFALLLPLGLLAFVGVNGPARDALAQANLELQLRLGIFNPALAAQALAVQQQLSSVRA